MKSNPRADALETELRLRIGTGRYQPGERLPNRSYLIQQYGVSGSTLQKVFSRLIESNMVVSRGQLGTFVSQRQPKTYRFALVHPGSVAPETMPDRFIRACQAWSSKTEDEVRTFLLEPRRYTPDRSRLLSLAKGHELAGVLVLFDLYSDQVLQEIHEMGIPQVAISPSAGRELHVPSLDFDYYQFVKRCGDEMLRRPERRNWSPKQHRILIISNLGPQTIEGCIQLHNMDLKPTGIQLHKHWHLRVHAGSNVTVQCVLPHYLRGKSNQIPNTIIVTDDTFTEAVLQGVLDAGKYVPDDVVIYSHTNFPLSESQQSLPVEWIGFDMDWLIHHTIDMLRKCQGDEHVDRHSWIPAFVQNENRDPSASQAVFRSVNHEQLIRYD